MLIDDIATVGVSRHAARTHLDELLAEPLFETDDEHRERISIKVTESDEAKAMSESEVWL